MRRRVVHRSGFGEAAGSRPFRASLPEGEGEPFGDRLWAGRRAASSDRPRQRLLPVGATETGTQRVFAVRLLAADEPAVETEPLAPLFEADSDRYLTARRLGEARLRFRRL